MIFTQEHFDIVCDHNSEFVNLANTIAWLTDGCPQMIAEFDLLKAFISKDYNRIRQEIQPFFFSEENFIDDVTNMYNKILEVEMEIVYENIMSELEIGYNEETNEILIQRWED